MLHYFPSDMLQQIIQFSKTKSDIHAKKDGDFEEHHKKRLQTKGMAFQPLKFNLCFFLLYY